MNVFQQIKSRFDTDKVGGKPHNFSVTMDDSFQARLPEQHTPVLSSHTQESRKQSYSAYNSVGGGVGPPMSQDTPSFYK